MLLSMLEHYWRTGCAPLPRDEDQLFAIARAHRPTWRRYKPVLLSIFEAVRPGLEAYHRKREGNYAGLIEASARSNSRRALKALQDKRPPHAGIAGAVLTPKKDAIQTSRPAPLSERNRPRLTDKL
jgi:uncharacterized protein YdaU (DUF1376 family)